MSSSWINVICNNDNVVFAIISKRVCLCNVQHEEEPKEDSTTFKALIKMNSDRQHTIVPQQHLVDQQNTIRTSSNATTIIEVGESTREGQQQQQMHEVSSSSAESVDTTAARRCKSLEFLRSKYSMIKRELFDARSRIEELEENLVVSD